MIDFSNRRIRRIAMCAGASLLGLGGFGWAGYEAHTEAETLAQEALQLEQRIAAAQREIALIPKLEETVLRLRTQVAGQVKILPDDAEINEFVDKLTQFASQSGVRIDKLDDSALQQRNARRGATKETFDKIVYKLELVAGSNELLAFLDAFENRYERFVRITNFRVRGDPNYERRLKEGPTQPLHEVTIEIETYVYNPRGRGGDPVSIPQEEQKLSKLISTGRIDPEASDVLVERFQFDPRSDRRDVFIDPRILKSKEDAEREERLAAEQTELEALVSALAAVRKLAEAEAKATDKVRLLQAQEATDVALRALADRVTKLTDENGFQLEETVSRFDKDVRTPVRELLASRGSAVFDPAQRVVAELRLIRERLRSASEAKEHARVIQVAGEVDNLRGLAKGMAEVEALVAEIDGLRREAQIVAEFDKLELKFGGSIVKGGEDHRAVVIINGKSFLVGDEVQSDLKLLSVNKDALHFEFRGVPVIRSLKTP